MIDTSLTNDFERLIVPQTRPGGEKKKRRRDFERLKTSAEVRDQICVGTNVLRAADSTSLLHERASFSNEPADCARASQGRRGRRGGDKAKKEADAPVRRSRKFLRISRRSRLAAAKLRMKHAKIHSAESVSLSFEISITAFRGRLPTRGMSTEGSMKYI